MANSLLPSPLEPHRLQVYCQQAGLVHHIWYHRANSIVINSLCSLGANPARGCNSRFEPLRCMAPGTRDALKLETFLDAPIPIRSLSVGHDNGQVLFKPLLVLIKSFPSSQCKNCKGRSSPMPRSTKRLSAELSSRSRVAMLNCN